MLGKSDQGGEEALHTAGTLLHRSLALASPYSFYPVCALSIRLLRFMSMRKLSQHCLLQDGFVKPDNAPGAPTR